MSRPIIVAALAIALFAAPGLVPAAQADSWLGFGVGFNIGGFHFNVGFRAGGDYYVRTDHRIGYRGYQCSDRCYRDRDHYYHHESCPLIAHHFDRYGYHPREVFATWGPRIYRDRDYGYYRDYGYDREYREDRYYRRGERYDRRGRGYDRERGHWDRYGRHHDHDRCLRDGYRY